MKAIALAAQSIKAAGCGDCGCRRHGEHEQRPLRGTQCPVGLSHEPCPRASSWTSWSSTSLGDLQRLPHGNTAEAIAKLYNISRQEQDSSPSRATSGPRGHRQRRPEGRDRPRPAPQKKGDPKVFDVDESPMDTSLEKMRSCDGLQEGRNRDRRHASGIK